MDRCQVVKLKPIRMKITKKISIITLLVCTIIVVFGFTDMAFADTYTPAGVFTSTNILPAGGTAVSEFSYVATVPANTTLKIQFGYNDPAHPDSADFTNWYNSSGVVGGFDTLTNGAHTIDLANLGWRGKFFYYKMVFSSTDSVVTPSLDSITLYYTAIDGDYTYKAAGVITSTNLLSANSTGVSSFSYVATIPGNATAKIQFSYDKPTDDSSWYNSSGTVGGFDTLSNGANEISLVNMGWKGPYFYYRMVFTSTDGVAKPSLDSVTLSYMSIDGQYITYNTTGSFISTNLLDGQNVASIDAFDYSILAMPTSTGVTIQFSQNNANWYSSAGVLGGSDVLSSGSHSVALSTLAWSSANFYYRVNLTSTGTSTPVLDMTAVDYLQTTTAVITLSAATNITPTTATLNGDIVSVGSDNPTVTMYWGTTDHGTSTTGWDYYDANPSEPQGVAPFSKNITGLTVNTTYYFTAKATNSSGNSWPVASGSFNTGEGSAPIPGKAIFKIKGGLQIRGGLRVRAGY